MPPLGRARGQPESRRRPPSRSAPPRQSGRSRPPCRCAACAKTGVFWCRASRSATLNRAGFCGGSNSCEDGAMTKRTPPFSPEVRERAVRMVLEHQGEHDSQYGAIRSIAAKIGCSGETLRNWVRQAERDQGVRAGPTTDERERIKALERGVRERGKANEILRKPGACFARAGLDRRRRT